MTAHPHVTSTADILTHFAVVAELFNISCLDHLRLRSKRRTATALLRTSPRQALSHRGSAPRASFEYLITANTILCFRRLHLAYFCCRRRPFVTFSCLADSRMRSERRTAPSLLRTSRGKNLHTGEVRRALLSNLLLQPFPILLSSPALPAYFAAVADFFPAFNPA